MSGVRHEVSIGSALSAAQAALPAGNRVEVLTDAPDIRASGDVEFVGVAWSSASSYLFFGSPFDP